LDLWFTEKQTPNVGITCRANKSLHYEQTQFQEMAIVDTLQFGKMLVLDGTVQTTIGDEFIYHEMITHVALFTHPNPKNVLIIGGGDGGTVREVLKHPSVETVELVEIDERVVEVCKEYLPEISCKLGDPRVKVVCTDGIEYVRNAKDKYDVILVDSPDPVGPAVGLFARDFYMNIYGALRSDGLFVAQTESPFFNDDVIKRIWPDIAGIFPIHRMFLAAIPTYPSGLWSFTCGSKVHDPLAVDTDKIPEIDTRYYSPEIHKTVFGLPKFVKSLLK
jgi:spermidine synthase